WDSGQVSEDYRAEVTIPIPPMGALHHAVRRHRRTVTRRDRRLIAPLPHHQKLLEHTKNQPAETWD
ncbi:hypothetical protein V499_08998, partial [Pseudogymnoascus sp. VKM F-103]